MTNPLLTLLKFGSNGGSSQSSPQQQAGVPSRPEYGNPSLHSVHGRGISASDLVASFTGTKSTTPTPRDKTPATPSTNHQDALLQLLNQTTSRVEGAQQKFSGSTDFTSEQLSEDLPVSRLEDQHSSLADAKSSVPGRYESPIRFFGSSEIVTPTPFEPQTLSKCDSSQKSGTLFTYVNPFEKLAASSPSNAKPTPNANGEAYKRKIKSSSPAAVHASSRRKLTPSGNEVLQSIENPTPAPLDDRHSQLEALMSIGPPSGDAETVAEALNEVGGKVDRQVENALAEAEAKTDDKEREIGTRRESAEAEKAAQYLTLHDATVKIEGELDSEENKGLLEESSPTTRAETVKDGVNETAQGKNGDEWESAEAEETAVTSDSAFVVQVYQFPMRPFVSIDLIQKEPAIVAFREESVVNIARFKKDFDQIDRTLATATNEFIVYGMPKHGGIRIIQQDNGNSSLIFSKSQDRIFNVGISMAHSGSSLRGHQTVIATGVSGTVYWTTIAQPEIEVTQVGMEKQGLIIPPVPSQSDSSSGGQLKTRAKKSNRHPEFFAIGRGKSIYIIHSSHAQKSNLVNKDSAVMDTEKYLAERNLKVNTGKAGKDFSFSEDDSTIVTLDKAGKLRIWDIRELTDEANAAASMIMPIEVKTPMLTFSTAHSSEKSWPTSVLFADKLRPYTKGIALRYIIVGMKQNHTLQLWDLCLSKAVQELSFPHGKETDAICSVTYHPASGIITVGHPTRNSIYFIHLSAPKYNLPAMSQAKFVQCLINKDATLPKAEATAIMSGMREFSFETKGQLRSVELVPSSGEPTRSTEDDEEPMLFELYVLHSKGVTCLGIKREDLGWSKDSRVVYPLDAEQEGRIIVKDLRELSTVSASEPSTASANGEIHAPTTPAKKKSASKESSKSERTATDDGHIAPSTADKVDKKKSKRNGAIETAPHAAATSSASETYATAAQHASTSTPQATPNLTKQTAGPSMTKPTSGEGQEPAPSVTEDSLLRPMANGDSISLGMSGHFIDKELKKIEHAVSAEFNKALGRELEALYRRFTEDKRVQDAAGAAKQDAMLRLVSSTLSDNVEKSLSRIIQKNIHDSVVPSIIDITSATLNDKLSTVVAKQIHDFLPTAMKSAIPGAIGQALQAPQLLQSISDKITKSMTGHVEREFNNTLHTTIVPAFTNLAVDVAQKIGGETERRVRDQLQQAEMQHRDDRVKIDQLTDLVNGLSKTVHKMATAQTDFQADILKLQRKPGQDSQVLAPRHSPTPSESVSMNVTPEQAELEAIATSMNEGRFEDATIMVRI